MRSPTLPPPLRAALEAGELQRVEESVATSVPAGASAIQLAPGQFLAARLNEEARTEVRRSPSGIVEAVGGAGQDSVVVLPLQFYGRAEDASAVDLRPAMVIDVPLRYNSGNGMFQGSMLIGLEDRLAPAFGKDLSGPITMTLAGTDSISPRTLTFARTNQTVRVAVSETQPLDSLRLQIVPQFNMSGVYVWLPVRPAMVIPNVTRRIAGLGIETVRIPITIRGTLLSGPVTIAVATDKGSLDEDTLIIGPGGSATVGLRSKGIGPARVTATHPSISPTETTIEFGWPLLFPLAALAGGAIGAAAAETTRKRRTKRIGRAIIGGALIGFVVAIAYFALGVMLLGINLTGPRYNEAAVFGLALLGGMLGIPALTALRDRTEGKPAAAGT